jgi:hypothetical protein
MSADVALNKLEKRNVVMCCTHKNRLEVYSGLLNSPKLAFSDGGNVIR